MSNLQFLKNDLSEGSRKGYNFLEAAAQPPVTTFENWGIRGWSEAYKPSALSIASLLSELLHSRGAPRAAAASTGRRISQYRGHFLPVQHRGRSDWILKRAESRIVNFDGVGGTPQTCKCKVYFCRLNDPGGSGMCGIFGANQNVTSWAI